MARYIYLSGAMADLGECHEVRCLQEVQEVQKCRKCRSAGSAEVQEVQQVQKRRSAGVQKMK
jgi:hypothetical protein